MKWYLVEDNGTVVTLEADKTPSWLTTESGRWQPSLAEATARTRAELAYPVKRARLELEDAERALARFEHLLAGGVACLCCGALVASFAGEGVCSDCSDCVGKGYLILSRAESKPFMTMCSE